MRDQLSDIPQGQGSNVTEMGANPEGGVGPRRVMRLSGPASAYSIVSSNDGEAWLVMSSEVDGTLDPGTLTGDRLRISGSPTRYTPR